MGKTTASCFKIISCGGGDGDGDGVDHDDLRAPADNKGSSGRGWSFRKRSARHRVLSNTVNSETPSSVNKESPESAAVNFHAQPNSTLPEKTSVVQWTEEKVELPSQVEPKVADQKAAGEDDITDNATYDESNIIIIQAAARGYLARKEVLKQKNIIKLQAVVRGHLVRSHAVGTLRCVQAIIKMQALVRARRARLQEDDSGALEKHSQSNVKRTGEIKPKRTYAYISIETLLSNRFARQLMESTPRTKPITIKCDPLKSDSAWKWLERWMSVSPVSNEEPLDSGTVAEQHDKEHLDFTESKQDHLILSDSESTNTESAVPSFAEASVYEHSLISEDTTNFDSPASQSITPPPIHVEVHKIEETNSIYDIPESAPCEIKESESILKVEEKSPIENEETGKEGGIPDMEKTLTEQTEAEAKKTEQPESEAKKISRKASNPSFIAAQSKFEELSSAATSSKSTNSINHDPNVESRLDKASSLDSNLDKASSLDSSLDKASSSGDQPVLSSEVGLVENSISHAPAIQVGGSECGTELSISSTLDSPDRSEVGINDLEQDPKVSDEAVNPGNAENIVLEDNGTPNVTEIEPSYTDNDQLERFETANSAFGEAISAVIAADSPQLETKPEADHSNPHVELVSESSHMAYKSSPEASPRSHTTYPESQATPSSQVSVKPKKSRGDKSDSSSKTRSLSADKKSISNRNQDSASRNSVEQLPEHKSGKRRNSFGSTKPDNADQEPRDSSSSYSLPSYMQATESARAKAITNGSPRSSPDVHDKEIYLKKRHSLPGTNGRQGSPRIQRSLSQAQQNAKANGTQSPNDRKWRR